MQPNAHETTTRINRDFCLHPSTPNTVSLHEEWRTYVIHLAEYSLIHLPGGREKSLVLTKLEEVLMWGNAAIAREGK